MTLTFDRSNSVIRTDDDRVSLKIIRWYRDFGHQFILQMGERSFGIRVKTQVDCTSIGGVKTRLYTIEDMACDITWWERYPEGQHVLGATTFKDRREQDLAIHFITDIFSHYDALMRDEEQASKAVFTDGLNAKLSSGGLIEMVDA